MKLDIQRFANTVTTSFSESNISVPNNTSRLTINIYFSPNNSITWFQSATLYCTCNGVQKSKKVSLSKGGHVDTSFTFDNIKHNSDGSKTVSWSWSCSTGTSVLGDLSRSGTRTLTTINRYGYIKNVSGNTTDSTITITYESTNANYEYDLDIIKGNDGIGTRYKVYDNLESSLGEHTINVSIESDYFNDYTNTTEAPITYILWTSRDDGSDGDSYKTTINLNSNVVPSVTIGTLSEANETMQSLDWKDLDLNPIFVQNKSQLNIPIIANGIYGSNIVSIVTAINGNVFNASNIITPILLTSGQSTITTTVTDSRGRTATTTKTYNVESYANPTITSVEAQRCLQDGTIDEDGTYILYTFVGSISPVANHNSKIFQIGYKKTTDENYTFATISSNYLVNENNSVSSFTISPDYSYDIIFQAVDSFMTTAIGRELTVGFDLMNFNASGKAMAIGKVSEAGANEELLEIDLPTTILQDTDVQGNVNTQSITINNEPIITIETYEEYTGATASDSTNTITYNIAKNGYTPVGIVGINCDHSRASLIRLFRWYINGNEASVSYRNVGTNPLVANDTSITINVIYIKS